MVRVVLINPTMKGYRIPTLDNLVIDDMSSMPPLGLLYLAAYLRQNCPAPVKIEVVDTEGLPMSRALSLVTDAVTREKADVVGVSSITLLFHRAVLLARAARRARPDSWIVAGGIHPSAYPRRTLDLGVFDAVVCGEGERPFSALVSARPSGVLPRGEPGLLSVRDDPDREAIPWAEPDIDSLPYPDRALRPEASWSLMSPGKKMTTMMSSRGCPFSCSFCCSSGLTHRVRSAEGVVSEMAALADSGYREILFWDDTFNVPSERALEICRLLEKAKLPLSWQVQCRVEGFDRHMALRFKRAGCTRVFFGVESGSPSVLKGVGKSPNLENTLRAFKACRKAGIRTKGCFILGFPGESLEEMEQTIRFAVKCGADYAQFQPLFYIPGNRVYRQAVRAGLIAPDEFDRHLADPSEDYALRVGNEVADEKELGRIL